MKINRKNYEAYLMDYIEGNLQKDVEKEVLCFLDNNPDIKNEASDLMDGQLTPYSVNFEDKELLKKDQTKDIEEISKFEQLSIAFLENEISPTEQKQLDKLLANSKNKRREHNIIQNLRLKVDRSIHFEEKHRLKHFKISNSRKITYRISTVAATILFLVSLGYFIDFNSKIDKGKIIASSNFPIENSREIIFEETKQITDLQKKNIAHTVINELDTPYRTKSVVEIIDLKQIVEIEGSNDSHALALQELVLINKPMEYGGNEANIADESGNKNLKESLLKKRASKKITLASTGKAFTKFLGKVLRKNIRVEKKVLEDGRKLYAVKAGSLELYANIKSRKKNKSSKTPD